MSATDNAGEIPDFKNTEMGQLWTVQCTDTHVIYEYSKYLRDLMLWMETEGEKLLKNESPWSKEQFESSKDRIAILAHHMPKLIPFDTLLRMVLKKGISSLKTLAETQKIQRGEAEMYLRSITFFFEPGAPCSLQVNDNHASEDSAKMIDSLIAIAQIFQDEHMLERISRCRFIHWGSDVPRELYVKHFKNW